MALHTELPVYREPYKKEMLSTVGMKTGVYILKIQAQRPADDPGVGW